MTDSNKMTAEEIAKTPFMAKMKAELKYMNSSNIHPSEVDPTVCDFYRINHE